MKKTSSIIEAPLSASPSNDNSENKMDQSYSEPSGSKPSPRNTIINVGLNEKVVGGISSRYTRSGSLTLFKLLDYADDIDDFKEKIKTIEFEDSTVRHYSLGNHFLSKELKYTQIPSSVLDSGKKTFFHSYKNYGWANHQSGIDLTYEVVPYSRIVVLHWEMFAEGRLSDTYPWVSWDFKQLLLINS
ncbi:hypothetical protein [Spiroplasma endosymbiont of Panorpa germanica]|uniref:hypothetical protein n=1 Tax=Spiroplasma endosymbiont of Panorpa germanica TaxID=3066314 RepID=UPI0030D41DEE